MIVFTPFKDILLLLNTTNVIKNLKRGITNKKKKNEKSKSGMEMYKTGPHNHFDFSYISCINKGYDDDDDQDDYADDESTV